MFFTVLGKTAGHIYAKDWENKGTLTLYTRPAAGGRAPGTGCGPQVQAVGVLQAVSSGIGVEGLGSGFRVARRAGPRCRL